MVLFGSLTLICHLMASCTKTEVVERTDTLVVRNTDTIRTTIERNTSTIEYRDRWRDHFVVVNPITGDTTKEVIKEKEYLSFSKTQHDSINIYRAKIDSLLNIKNKVVTKEKELNWWQRFKIDTYIYVLIALLAHIVAAAVYIVYRIRRRKIC